MSRGETTLTGTILARIAECCAPLAGNSGLVIALNPTAGRLSTAEERRKVVRELECAGPLAPRGYTLLSSHFPGQLRGLLDALCLEESRHHRGLLVASCGGDGTHAEVLETAEPWARQGLPVRVIRWPLGTGNDAADSVTISGLIERLRGEPVFCPAASVVVRTRLGSERRAYNIASLGVDALITDLTNRFRKIVPGDIYRRIADVSVLFYEQLIGAGEMEIEYSGPGKGGELTGRFMLVAVGAGAPRTYGNQMRVLPDRRNLCAIERGHIGKKVILKRRFYAGRHIRDRKTTMATVRSATIRYHRRIPAQCDGEAFWLRAEDFPVTLSVEESSVIALERGEGYCPPPWG
ncbi:MAG: diacylglycerol/lipid kinase family protein [Alkalispirochaetaceae bacterium]